MKSRFKNPICISIIAAVLAIATIFTFIAVFLLPNISQAENELPQFNIEDLFNSGNLGSGNLGDILGGEGGSGLNLSGDIGLGGGGGNAGGEGNSVAYRIYADNSQNVYLKIKSFGYYTGRSWEDSQSYDRLLSYKGNQYSGDYLTGIALANNGAGFTNVAIEPMTEQYAIPYYVGALQSNDSYDIQQNDVYMEGTPPEQYRVNFYSAVDISKITLNLPKSVESFETRYRNFVYDNYLTIDGKTLEYMRSVINEQGFNPFSSNVIDDVANYVSTVARYDLNYDRNLDQQDNIAIAFLRDYQVGICQHYATAATLLFRALGIPARYTIGYASSAERNEWIDVTSNDAHAWVEVYRDGIGWICVEVTGSSVLPPPKPIPTQKVTLKPKNLDMKYDGVTTLYPNDLTGFEEYEKKGYTYDVVISGSQKELGKSYSKIESIVIYDSKGNDVTYDFEITLPLK